MPRCRRALVFTGARQGSTWLINSIEHCKYSMRRDDRARSPSVGALYRDDVFRRTELWKHFGEANHSGGALDVDGVLEYMRREGSVKIFPSVFWRRRADVGRLVRRGGEIGMAVMVLRRDVDAAWRSWVRAEVSGGWHGATGAGQGLAEEGEAQYRFFRESRQRYDRGVDQLVGEVGVDVDWFDYDEIKDRRVIVAERNGCWIGNCNFGDGQRDGA